MTERPKNSKELVAVGAVLVVALVAAAVLLGAAAPDTDGSPRSTFSLEEARSFTEFPVYYAGNSVAGVPLVAVLRRHDSANYISFIYGACEATSETGCAPQGEVQVWPACRRNPAMYAANRSPLAPRPAPMTVRGVPAAAFEDGHRLELQTGVATVVVFGESPAIVEKLTAQLRGVNNNIPDSVPLPAPALGAVDGTLNCG